MPAEEKRPAEKAAAVISMLGTERASMVFRYLTENEVEQLSLIHIEMCIRDRKIPLYIWMNRNG